MPSKVIVIGGPSGSGESTITKALIDHFPNFTRLITATTRPMRDGDQNEVDYYFFSKERFLQELEKGNILEHTYIQNRDTYYGSYKPDLEKRLASGKVVLVNPDLVGAKFYKEHYAALTLFIEPDSLESLRIRIRERSPNISEEELEQRMTNARHEIENEKSFYDYTIKNAQGQLETAIKEAIEIVEKYLASA